MKLFTHALKFVFQSFPLARRAALFLGVMTGISLLAFIGLSFGDSTTVANYFLTISVIGFLLISALIMVAYCLVPKQTYRIKTSLKVYSPFIIGGRYTLEAKVETFEMTKRVTALLNERAILFKVRKSDDLFDMFLEQLENAIDSERKFIRQTWEEDPAPSPRKMIIDRRYQKHLKQAVGHPIAEDHQ